MIQIIVIVVMCAITIGLVELFGLVGIALGLLLNGALISVLSWVSRTYFDPLARYEAERRAIEKADAHH